MNGIISSRVEDDYLLIVASGKINSNQAYQLQAQRYSEALAASGLSKVLIDERQVQYVPSLLLQMAIVNYYDSGELPQALKTWEIACVGPTDAMVFYDFWADQARKRGDNQRAFASMSAVRAFMGTPNVATQNIDSDLSRP